SLESKLQEYCLQFDSIEQFFTDSDTDRRKYRRFPLKGKVSAILLDNDGKATETSLRGEAADFSRGGLSFFIRISQKKDGRLLLGRTLRLLFDHPGKDGEVQKDVGGTIVAVRSHQGMAIEYSVHVEFDQLMDEEELLFMDQAS
ncbi:MAG: PilZ domain-containing protein, partial [Thermodesulfobacteriota bacterium]